jgi:hypothetical protein
MSFDSAKTFAAKYNRELTDKRKISVEDPNIRPILAPLFNTSVVGSFN